MEQYLILVLVFQNLFIKLCGVNRNIYYQKWNPYTRDHLRQFRCRVVNSNDAITRPL